MKIAIDMDDVCLEFTDYILGCIQREYALTIDPETIRDWDDNPLKNLRMFAGGGTWWDWLKTRDWLWTKCPAVEGAIGGIQQLRDEGHYIELLTTKPLWAEWTVWAWLGKWRPAVHQVTIVPTGGSKSESSTAELLVDDAVHNLEPWVKSGRPAIRYDRPWNRDFPEVRFLPVAYNWSEVVSLVGVIGQ